MEGLITDITCVPKRPRTLRSDLSCNQFTDGCVQCKEVHVYTTHLEDERRPDGYTGGNIRFYDIRQNFNGFWVVQDIRLRPSLSHVAIPL